MFGTLSDAPQRIDVRNKAPQFPHQAKPRLIRSRIGRAAPQFVQWRSGIELTFRRLGIGPSFLRALLERLRDGRPLPLCGVYRFDSKAHGVSDDPKTELAQLTIQAASFSQRGAQV